MPNTLIIANPVSANGNTGLRWSGIEARLRSEGLDFDVRLTESPSHATDLAVEASRHGYGTVICAGGDGTLNEVVNGLMSVDAASRPSLGVIPSGTGTDFARGMSLPCDLDGIVRMLKRGQMQPIDVGHVSFVRASHNESRYFINIAGLGFDGEVSDEVNRRGKRGGSMAYFLNVFRVLARFQNKHAQLIMTTPDGSERMAEAEYNMIAMCNGRYFGGGMLVSPNSDPHDGLFTVVVIEAMSRAEFAANFPKVYRGTHLSHPKVKSYLASAVRVEMLPSRDPGQRMFLEAEGELFGEAPATFEVVPGAIKLLIG